MATLIRAMTEADSPAVLAIHGEGIATGHATFLTGLLSITVAALGRRVIRPTMARLRPCRDRSGVEGQGMPGPLLRR